MPQFIDQLNRKVEIPGNPQRIISLVPSQTELLVYLGLRDRLVGVTKFCVHPNGLKNEKTIIGGTKNFHFDKINILKPDLIIGNKEENYQDGIKQLSQKYPVWMSDIYSMEEAFEMMLGIGEITGTSEKAATLVKRIRKDFDFVPRKRGTVVYLIWKDPLMAVGENTFIDDMLNKAGYENLIQKDRYPELSFEELMGLDPDYLLLSSEPYPFKQENLEELSLLMPRSKIILVNGEMFSWYGRRLLDAKAYFQILENQ
jgi:ABC-type Fe3+-hydroxamate transport system substrate-binding protein